MLVVPLSLLTSADASGAVSSILELCCIIYVVFVFIRRCVCVSVFSLKVVIKVFKKDLKK